jgi:hypothetical protein
MTHALSVGQGVKTATDEYTECAAVCKDINWIDESNGITGIGEAVAMTYS